MDIKQQLQKDLMRSMKERKRERVHVMRLLLNDIRQAEIDHKKELSPEDIIGILSKAAKQRKEAIASYKEGGRDDLLAEEETELSIIKEYLPDALSTAELEEIIDGVIGEVDATGMQDMGKVMSKVMPQIKGRADGSEVQKIVRTRLT